MAQTRDGLYKRESVYWMRTDPVTKKARSTGCRDRPAARLHRAQRERLAADPAHAAAQTAVLSEWIARVIRSKEAEKKVSKATLSIYRCKLGHWLRLAPGALLAQVEPTFVDDYVTARRLEDVTDHTISKEVTHLLYVLKAAKRAKHFSGDVEALRPPELHTGYKPRKRALDRVEFAALFRELSPFLGTLAAICVTLGCRLSEALKLAPGDFEWQANRVHIRGTKTDESDRYVPMLSIFKDTLRACTRHLPLGELPNNLYRDIAAACARANIDVCTPNDWRRTHATLLAEAGVDKDVTRRLLGHTTSILVDQVYAQPSTRALGKLAEVKLISAAPLQKRYSDGGGPVKTGQKHRADYEIRTRDLRFTKPLQEGGSTGESGFYRGLSGVNQAELESDPGSDVTKTLQWESDDASHSAPALLLAYAAESVLGAHASKSPVFKGIQVDRGGEIVGKIGSVAVKPTAARRKVARGSR